MLSKLQIWCFSLFFPLRNLKWMCIFGSASRYQWTRNSISKYLLISIFSNGWLVQSISFFPFLLYFCVFHLNYLTQEGWVSTRISYSLRALLLSNTNLSMARVWLRTARVILVLTSFLYPMEYQSIRFFSYYFFFLSQRNFQLKYTTFKENAEEIWDVFIVFLVIYSSVSIFLKRNLQEEKRKK